MKDVKVFLGRFQPFTAGHLSCAIYKDLKGPDKDQADKLREQPDVEAVKKLPTVILSILTTQYKTDARHPFEANVIKKEFDIIKRQYKDEIIDILYVTSADICAWGELLKKEGYRAAVWLTGSDEYKMYKSMAMKVPEYEEHNKKGYDCKDAYTKSFWVEDIPRNMEDGISGTKVRKALKDDDFEEYKRMMPKGTEKLYNTLRDIVNIYEHNLSNYIKQSISLYELLHEKETNKYILEGGHVFNGGSDPIKKEYIKGTIDEFIKAFVSIFPKAKGYFEEPKTLGSVGKKDVSGDIDLAIDEKCLDNIDDWNLDKDEFDKLVEQYAKRARTSTPAQLAKRAAITLIGNELNRSGKILCNTKGTSGGVLFCQFPQYHDGKISDQTVQIDINFGNVDWLTFAYFSDAYKDSNVKGLHRTQLLLHLFVNKGYSFNHNYGVKKDNKVVADTPEECIKLLNKLYNINITRKILENYHELQKYIREHLSEEDLNNVYDIYLKTLDSTRCDIPDDLQDYWLKNKDKLKLTGKFLPDSSRLKSML